jgi:heptose I phosphotransferase
MQLYLADDFSRAWEDKDPFTEAKGLRGKVYRQLEGRRTLRFEMGGKAWFLKYHEGVGWIEILKNLLQLRLPVLGATNEKAAIERLQDAGVDTMVIGAFGARGINPARRCSFIITEAIEPSASLEDYCASWKNSPPLFAEKLRLINKVAEIAGRMHEAGMTHRDFYLCHFLLKNPGVLQAPQLALIDLHRSLVKKRVSRRWRLKDLAGVYHSAFDIGLTQRDGLRFIRAYRQQPLREVLASEGQFWRQVQHKADLLYAKAIRKGYKETAE